MKRDCFFHIVLLLMPLVTMAQGTFQPGEPQADDTHPVDSCSLPTDPASNWLLASVPMWGYGYTDLRSDLLSWSQSPYVRVDSIGSSVQGRALWELTITDPIPAVTLRRTVYIHARTHPNEVQTTFLVNALVDLLISEWKPARLLREQTRIHIVPMYNPDGVELEYGRENAHMIDIERDWATDVQEPESAALKKRFIEFMNSTEPIEIALNLHSALACKRYFVYHDAQGTSESFAAQQQRFITGVRSHFITGIEPWNYYVSWDTGTPTLFPESWWWRTHHENVMALTYEDMNCPTAGEYDSTARAILEGIIDYLGIVSAVPAVTTNEGYDAIELLDNYPNPFTASTVIRYTIPRGAHVRLQIFDLLGRAVTTLLDEPSSAGLHEVGWDAKFTPQGVYLCRLQVGDVVRSRTIRILR